MAVLIDSSVFIAAERGGGDLGALLVRVAGTDEPLGMAAITASELLVGVHRARPARDRTRVEAFVEGILASIPVLPFDLRSARTHARVAVHLRRAGLQIGSHDLLIAATAITYGYAVATANAREFIRVPGLEVRGIS
jgi:tRNA(fMet)-specific endonuclease VapC